MYKNTGGDASQADSTQNTNAQQESTSGSADEVTDVDFEEVK